MKPLAKSLRSILPILPALLVAAPVSAQGEPWRGVFEDVTEINVINVEVIVSDAKGQPVTGLGADDFELLEDGRPVEISNFYAVESGAIVALPGAEPATAEASPPERAPLQLLIYVDNANIAPANRGKTFARLREFLLDSLRPGMRVMVATNDGPAGHWAPAVRQGLTTVAHDVFVTLDQLAGESVAGGPRFELDRRALMRAIEQINAEEASGLFATKGTGNPAADDAIRQSIVNEALAIVPQIRTYSEDQMRYVQRSLQVLDRFVTMAAGLPGRKSVLYVSDGLPVRPGEAIFEAFERRFDQIPELVGRVSPMIEASRYDANDELEKLVARANASRVTFYAFDSAPSDATTRGSAESAGSAGGNFASWNDSYDSNLQSDRQASLIGMADGTGGRYGLTATTLEVTLDGILADFDNHYSLGYVADRREEDRQRNIQVRVRGNQGWRVRHRSSLSDKTAAERASERARALLLVAEPERLAVDENPLEVALEARGQEAQKDGNFVVPLLVKVPLGKLVLLPGESEHIGKVSMFVVVRDDLGRTSDVNHHLCPIRIPNADVLTALGQSAGCGMRLLMRRGPQRIAVSVLDETAAIHSTVSLELDVGASTGDASPAAGSPAAGSPAAGTPAAGTPAAGQATLQ